MDLEHISERGWKLNLIRVVFVVMLNNNLKMTIIKVLYYPPGTQ